MPPTTSGNKIDRPTIQKAVTSLLKWKTPPTSGKNTDDFIYLVTTLNKTPQEKYTKTPIKIPLPHSINPSPESCRSCLIIDDRPKPTSQKLTFDFTNKKIQSLGIPISKIIKFSKIKKDYDSFEKKVNFFNEFEVFLVDGRLVEVLEKVLGKVFYGKRKKVPVPVELRRDGDWKGEIEKGFSCSLLWLSSGSCSVVRVGRCDGMSVGEIVENVVACMHEVGEVVPKKWSGVKCMHLKFFDSLALPVYEKKDRRKVVDG